MNTKIKNEFNPPSRRTKWVSKFFSSSPWSMDTGLLLLRLCCLWMALHGWSKLVDFSDGSTDWPDPFHVGPVVSKGLTVFAELFCTILILIGLLTRAALIPLIICMTVIVFVVHAEDPFPDREHPMLYLMMYLTLLFTGPGKFSLDYRMFKKLE